MKLATFVPSDSPSSPPRIGALTTDDLNLVDLQALALARNGQPADALQNMLTLLDHGKEGMQLARGLLAFAEQAGSTCNVPLASVKLLSPIPIPRSIRDCMVFQRHLAQATRSVVRGRFPPLAWLDAACERLTGRSLLPLPRVWYERPVYYKGNPHSVVGHNSPVSWPSFTERLDFELEFGVFIGRRGRDIPIQNAKDYIAGYTIFNDFSARDVQLREMQGRLGPAKGKDFDTGNVLGPYLVTPDEIPDPYNLRMTVRVNGETWGEGNSGQMHHRFEEIIAYISRDETLFPGEFIAAGTVGDGCGLELNRWLKPGDVVDLEIEHLGVLRNQVVRS